MKPSKTTLILSSLLPVQILLVQLASSYPNSIETYYSNGIYPYISYALRFVFGWVPFSVGDVLLVVLLFLSIRFVILLIKNRFKNFFAKIVNFTAWVSVIYGCFYLFWGLNYYRLPLTNQLNFSTKAYTTAQLYKTTNTIATQLNKYHSLLTVNDTLLIKNPHTRQEMYAIAYKSFTDFNSPFLTLNYKQKSIKSALLSTLQSYNGTSGYINPLTGEATVNKNIPKTGYPTTICHEVGHQLGFAAENEANFIGFIAANRSKNLYFKYASYRMAFAYCIRELRKRDPELEAKMWQQLHKGIIKDYNASYQFWQYYKNPFEPYVKKGYNAYLKANNQAKGIASYNYVVDLLIGYFEIKKDYFS